MLVGIEQLLAAAEQAHRAGRPQEAEQYCRQVLARDSKNVRATVILGILNAQTGRLAPAIQILQTAVGVDPNSFDANLWLGLLIGSSGNANEAVFYARKAVELQPNNAQALSSLARCLVALGLPDPAADYLLQAVQIEPRVPPLREALGDALRKAGRFDEAIEAYRSFIELNPNSPIGQVRLADCIRKKSRHADITAQIKRAFELTPDNVPSLMLLTNALVESDLRTEAIKAVERVIELDPKSAVGYSSLGTLYQQLGQLPLAVVNLEKALAIDPSIAHAYVDLASCKRITPQDQPFVDRIVARLRDRSMPEDNRALLHYALGKAYDDLGSYKQAMQHYDEANGTMRKRLVGNPFDHEFQHKVISSMIATLTPAYFQRHTELNNPSDLPILIVGMIRSGTTLVEQIVSSHPKVAAGGERDYLSNTWRRVLEPANGAPHVEEAKKVAQGYLDLLGNVDPSKKHITDKMPLNFITLGLAHALFPNAKLIHCRRNPLDTCISIYTTYFHDAVNIAHDPETIVFFYKEYLRIMDHWRKVLPADRFMEIDYEELVTNREAATRRLIDFCGLEWDDACLHHERNEGTIITPSWWQARQPVYTSSIGRWKNYEPWLGEFKQLANLSS